MLSEDDFDSVPLARAGGEVATQVRERLETARGDMVGLLEDLVSIESSSDDPDGLRRMADRLHGLFEPLGEVVRHRMTSAGPDHLLMTVAGADRAPAPHVVVLGHYDTVWPRGTLDRMPFAVDEHGIATGPGCFDMKGGLVLLYFALREMQALGEVPGRNLTILMTGDEEVGSTTSRELIDEIGRGAGEAFVLEAPLPGGVLKTARKGTISCHLRIEGRAAHSGIEPEKGASAIVELAHQIQRLDSLNDLDRGTMVNVGVVRGGTRLNVVPARAEAEVHVRVATIDEAERLDQALRELQPARPGTRLSFEVRSIRPPMERTPATERLFERARSIASAMGLEDLGQGSTGGGSDANLVAAMGIPTLDGLGPHGGGAHAEDEHVVVASMPHRAALLAGLLAGA